MFKETLSWATSGSLCIQGHPDVRLDVTFTQSIYRIYALSETHEIPDRWAGAVELPFRVQGHVGAKFFPKDGGCWTATFVPTWWSLTGTNCGGSLYLDREDVATPEAAL